MQSDHHKNDFLDPFWGTFYWLLKHPPPERFQNTKNVFYNFASSWQWVVKNFSCFMCQLFTGTLSHQPMLQRKDFITKKKKRHFLSKVKRLFWSRNIKGIFFKFFPIYEFSKTPESLLLPYCPTSIPVKW